MNLRNSRGTDDLDANGNVEKLQAHYMRTSSHSRACLCGNQAAVTSAFNARQLHQHRDVPLKVGYVLHDMTKGRLMDSIRPCTSPGCRC